MTSGVAARSRDRLRLCAGCLGSRACWVCLGSGHAVPERLLGTCGRCAGTGVCDVCASVVVPAPREAG